MYWFSNAKILFLCIVIKLNDKTFSFTTNANVETSLTSLRLNPVYLLLFCGSIQAQTLADSSNVELEELYISSSKWNEKSSDNTKSISKISKLDMALYNPQTAADLLSVSEEVHVQKSQQGGGSPMIRGFSTNRLLYSMDGIRLNNAIYRGGNIHNVISLDPNAISSTEILFGPGAVSYGSDAIGAVMSFSSLTHREKLPDSLAVHGSANFRFSSANNEFSGHYDIAIAKKRLSFISSVSKTKFDDLRMGSHGPSEYLQKHEVLRFGNMDSIALKENQKTQSRSGFDQIHTLHKIRFKATKHLDIDFNVHYSENSEFARNDRLNPLNSLPEYAVWNYGPQRWLMNHLGLKSTKEKRIYSAFKINFYHQHFEESRITRAINSEYLTSQVENVNAYGVNLDFKKRFKKQLLYYGAEAIYNKVNSWGNSYNMITESHQTSAARYPESDWSIFALYFKYNVNLNEHTVMTSGIRANSYHLNSNFTTQNNFYNLPFSKLNINRQSINGIVGIAFNMNSFEFKSNLSSGFRAPNVDDIGKIFDFENGQIVVPNDKLKSEVAYTADVSVSKKLKAWGEASATVFFTLLDDAMVRREFLLNGQDSILYNGNMSKVFAIQNASYAYVYGVSGKIKFRFTEGIQISSTINYQKGQEVIDRTSTPFRHAAPLFMTNSFRIKVKKLVLSTYHRYSASFSNEQLSTDLRNRTSIFALDNNGLAHSPRWHTFNVKGIFRLNDHWILSGGIENMADIRYRTYSSGIAAPGRNYIASIKVVF